MNAPTKAIFLSYASQDAEAARRICDALRASGLEVWFDQSELRGGEAWDRSIRRQIKDCALFVPIISASTESRSEGYFRLEWKLAVDRSHLMSEDQAFLLPIVIDTVIDVHARVPERFREVQWTHLPAGETSASFVERVRRLISDGAVTLPHTQAHVAPQARMHPEQSGLAAAPADERRYPGTEPPASRPDGAASSARLPLRHRMGIALGVAAVLAMVAVAFLMQGRWRAPPSTVSAPMAPAAFSPPPQSVAVLPFVNMSGDPKQDYFSDGLSEELLNSLVTIRELQVAARTSSFFFKGKDVDLSDVARKLNVGAVLEGSVRKDGSHVRITAQLINAVTGYHLWSQTYDRDLKNVLALQSEIATAVTQALQATLLSNAAAAIELGGTQNPDAFDAYLRGEKLEGHRERASVLARIASYDAAIRLDPAYAKAFVGKASALNDFAGFDVSASEVQGYFEQARNAAEKAVTLAPDLGQAHAALSWILASGFFDFTQALAAIERALALSPGDTLVLRNSVRVFSYVGRTKAAVVNAQRAAILDPLNAHSYWSLGLVLGYSQEYRRAIEALNRAFSLDPSLDGITSFRGLSYAFLGELDAARQSCATPPFYIYNHVCLAIVYHQQGRTSEAEAETAKIKETIGDAAAFQYAEIYAQWGDVPTALMWLETAYRLRDPGLAGLKIDNLLDPLRNEPRFQEILRKLKFPS
jgi:TolB-like protein/Flp pilus assembly protein TadD